MINRRLRIPFWGARAFDDSGRLQQFQRAFRHHLRSCPWRPHAEYSVFTQYDQEYYLQHEAAFLHKYKCFYAVSKTIAPGRILELGTHAGSGADAYISASPDADYLGFDLFDDGVHRIKGLPWRPRDVATRLFAARGFTNYRLIQVDLRTLTALPFASDFVVVDGAHDFDNEYADLKLALTAAPSFIFVDDSDDPEGARPALARFMETDLKGRIDYICGIGYIGGGLVIKLRDGV